MFRHKGKRRTFTHNLRLAAILSFIAGLVNITGLLSLKILTTNVTGHFAFFSEEFIFKDYVNAFVYLLFIGSFLLGAFFANVMAETAARIKPFLSQAAPLFVEAMLLAIIGIYGVYYHSSDSNKWYIAAGLLFTMGVQNSSVTHISQAKVRTTHLTGLFTDLGIELSQFFFYKKQAERGILFKSIYIKLIIILFFFLGCVIGGFLYKLFNLGILLIASAFLLMALSYDCIRYRYYLLKRGLK